MTMDKNEIYEDFELKSDSTVESLGGCKFRITTDGVSKVLHFKIRKLTPRECFRLMDVDDDDIQKIFDAGISNSQCYKLAGNSIVVGVLYHIFRKMFIDTGQDYKAGEVYSLF